MLCAQFRCGEAAVGSWVSPLSCYGVVFAGEQEMGLTDEDLAFVGVKDAAQRKALKIGARGLVEPMLHVEINGFFNFHSELVRERKAYLPFSVLSVVCCMLSGLNCRCFLCLMCVFLVCVCVCVIFPSVPVPFAY